MKHGQWILDDPGGEHDGHHITKNRWAIDFYRANPETSFWCLDCKEELVIEGARETVASLSVSEIAERAGSKP